jgi:hypothetical protein
MLVASGVESGGECQATSDLLPQVIGSIQTTIGGGTVTRASGIAVQVMVGDPVCQGDVIETAADGRIEIRFIDGTVFNLAGDTRVVLREFVCDTNRTGSALFAVTGGDLRLHWRPGGKDRFALGRHAGWKHSQPGPCRRVRHAVARSAGVLIYEGGPGRGPGRHVPG